MRKKKLKIKFDDHVKHPDLKKKNIGELMIEREYLKKIVPGINSAINPGQAIFHSSRLQEVEELLKQKGY